MSAVSFETFRELRQNWRPTALYAAALVALVVVGLVAWLGALDAWNAVSIAEATNKQLHDRLAGSGAKFSVQPPPGSPFLEGASQTLAGAALQQRVASVIADAGGVVLSSQVDLGGSRASDGLITLIVSCDLPINGLQKTLYDLEAGVPVLFVDRLVVQTAQSSDSGKRGQFRVQLNVSGQWEGAH